MKESIKALARNLEKHPAEYSVLALIVLAAVVMSPTLAVGHRAAVFCIAILAVAVAIIVLRLAGLGGRKAPDDDAAAQAPRNTTNDEGLTTHYDAPPHEWHDKGTYKKLTSVISNARHNIYMTGDGFHCRDFHSKKNANSVVFALRQALQSIDVNVVRVETSLEDRRAWAEKLAPLLEEFPDKFQFYLLDAHQTVQAVQLCVVDPGDAGCVVEVLFPEQKRVGLHAVQLPEVAVFIRERPNLGTHLAERIIEFCRLPYSRRIPDKAALLEALGGTGSQGRGEDDPRPNLS